MRLGHHTIVSGAVGAGLWASTGQPETLPIAVAAGVLPDADHLVDFYNWYVRGSRDRLILFLHGWEYAIGALLVYLFAFPEPWMLAVLIGYTTQIGGDQLFNGVRPYTYLLTVRLWRRFEVITVHDRDVTYAYESLVHSIPFVQDRLHAWFEARVGLPPGQRSLRCPEVIEDEELTGLGQYLK